MGGERDATCIVAVYCILDGYLAHGFCAGWQGILSSGSQSTRLETSSRVRPGRQAGALDRLTSWLAGASSGEGTLYSAKAGMVSGERGIGPSSNMFSIRSTIARSARLPAGRTLRTTALARSERDPAKPNSQGHAVRKSGQTLEGGMDVQSAGVKAGFQQARDGKDTQAEPYDTAAEDAGGQEAPSRQKEDALRDASSQSQAAHSAGAFKDHRAGAQSSGEYAGKVGGKEEAAAPSFTSTVKQALGLGVSKQEHQESKTGPGVSRQMHTSARVMGGQDGKAYSGSASDGAHKTGKPEERLAGEQNEHLKHKEAGQADSGKGNVSRSYPVC